MDQQAPTTMTSIVTLDEKRSDQPIDSAENGLNTLPLTSYVMHTSENESFLQSCCKCRLRSSNTGQFLRPLNPAFCLLTLILLTVFVGSFLYLFNLSTAKFLR